MDITLITQGKNLIHKKYLSFIETMYKALPGAKRFLSTRFRYRQYASYQEYSQNIVGTISISLDNNVSELYNSGANKISQSMLKKFMLPIIGGVILLALFYKFAIANRFSQPQQEASQTVVSEQQPTKDTPTTEQKKVVNADDSDTDKKPFYAVRCFNKSCNFKGVDYSFDENTMYKFINAFNCKVLIADNSDKLFTMYILRCDKDLSKVLDLYSKNSSSSKAVYNEETTTGSTIVTK